MNIASKAIPIIVFTGLGGIVVYKLGQKLGIFSTKETRQKKADENKKDVDNFWSPNKKLPPKSLILTPAAAKKLVDKLWKARGIFNDNEEAIYSVFRVLKTKSMVTSLAQAFIKHKGEDLYYWLKAIMSGSELDTVLKIVNSKPDYK